MREVDRTDKMNEERDKETRAVEQSGEAEAAPWSDRRYVAVWLALVAFTALTVMSAELHLGKLSTAVSICIASAKAMLVFLFFMHLKNEHGLFRWTFLTCILVLAVFILGTYFDVITR
jgi:cytochrome c oxidase subunit 4